jgi:glycosyltransferase involved in cell wall biosynthesis
MPGLSFSVVILALNEERNLPGCLRSIAGCDDIVLIDSGSTDATVALAEQAGARVFVRPFDNFAHQRNFAQTEVPFRHPWVFHLDADETFTPELLEECAVVAASPEAAKRDGYYAAPRMIFQGQWIPHCTDYPAWQARFVRAPQFRFIEVGHGQREAPGMSLGKLKSGYRHDLSAGGEAEWLAKHRRYAQAEARTQHREALRLGELFSSTALTRRRALKRAAANIPFRPLARFIYQYFLRGGFLDGRAGLRYCRLIARYEGFIAEERKKTRPI